MTDPTEAARADQTASLVSASPGVRALLEASLEGHALDAAGALRLFATDGADLGALASAADAVRQQHCGDDVSYVVNRNVNFTNVCVKACKFCAFSRTSRSEQAYFLEQAEIVRRCVEARDLGATEVCLQAGLAPGVDGRIYIDLCRAVKRAAPELHVHAFSPEEVKYGARLAGVSIRDYLSELRDAGLGSLPGTSAEVLVQSVRDVISPGRITVEEWITVIRSAHELGIPTTSTLMFGHMESIEQRVEHLALLRTLQAETGGFTEFVPLAFVHQEAPMFAQGLVGGLRAGPDVDDVTRLFAISRLFLGSTFRNLQVSWVKHGIDEAKRLLGVGANDLGGTLINESISTAAGAAHGQLMTPAALRRAIREVGRVPVQRDTRYGALRRFEDGDDPVDALDAVTDAEARFGSYAALSGSAEHRFVVRRKSERESRP